MNQSTPFNLHDATDPDKNIAVFASAGTGKTQLLISRILKLLLNDVDHSSILAITFTRKAAAEMQERLMRVLADWAQLDDQKLSLSLQEFSYAHDDNSILKARMLYEKLLFSESEIRITTFHAFCQDILKRFALHAGVPAGFHLIETTEELKNETRENIFMLAQNENHKKLRSSLFELLKYSNTVSNLKTVLDSFIDARSDWWSYTEDQTDSVEYAIQDLQDFLFSDSEEFTTSNSSNIDILLEFKSYLDAHSTQSNKKFSEIISQAIDKDYSQNELLVSLKEIFLTEKGETRKLKPSKVLEKSLGKNNMLRFIELHTSLSKKICDILELEKKLEFLHFNAAWFYVGEKLLNEYQYIKFNRGYLDFDDLEWYTYLLLTKHKESSWVQYKLDQRIEHILIDEFQDTNPTQWNLLLPLLEELAASYPNSNKSLFFVGDTKQSIYGFRRANPNLQFTASDWAKNNLNASFVETDISYRSSPAIIDFVNRIFKENGNGLSIKNYSPHIAHKTELWGEVQVAPIISNSLTTRSEIQFREPLTEHIVNSELNCYYQEGLSVANNIRKLIDTNTPIIDNGQARCIRYDDIIILARSRTHLPQIELALREHKILYRSLSSVDFLEHLEVQDILCLLQFLIQPHNDLALAQVLRSACFAMSDEVLMEIASQDSQSWYKSLESLGNKNSNLNNTYMLLESWRKLANKIPVHDLLDKIFFELNIIVRYTCNCPSNKKNQTISNLTQLLQLSLDFDSGRYSSIQSFLDSIKTPGLNLSPEKIAYSHEFENCVQIMTIHSAKGLESPVVFLVDSGSKPPNKRAYSTAINWPHDAKRPEQFMIIGNKATTDSSTKSLLNNLARDEAREELNLLYVALTRAKQYLFISGVKTKDSKYESWYSIISAKISNGHTPETEKYVSTFGIPPQIKIEAKPSTPMISSHKKELSKPFPALDPNISKTPVSDVDESASYGILVHKLLEIIGKNKTMEINDLHQSAELDLSMKFEPDVIAKAFTEVKQCILNPDYEEIFKEEKQTKILNEVPISYIVGGKLNYKIIDRLIIKKDSIHIIDYKTDREVTNENIPYYAKKHQTQLSTYFLAVNKLYPNRNIKASILFTNLPKLYSYDANTLRLIEYS